MSDMTLTQLGIFIAVAEIGFCRGNDTLRTISNDVQIRCYHMVRHNDRVPSAARRAFVEMILANKVAA